MDENLIIEKIAEAIGKHLGPLDGNSRWSPSYLDKIKWPDDYTPNELKLLRSTAIVAIQTYKNFK